MKPSEKRLTCICDAIDTKIATSIVLFILSLFMKPPCRPQYNIYINIIDIINIIKIINAMSLMSQIDLSANIIQQKFAVANLSQVIHDEYYKSNKLNIMGYNNQNK